MLRENQIYTGDCNVIMTEIPDATIDAIITDPPYFTTRLSFDKEPELDWNYMFSEFQRILKPNGWFFMFGTLDMYKKASDYFNLKFDYVWVKKSMIFCSGFAIQPYYRHEHIFAFLQKGLKKVSSATFNRDALKTFNHPPYSRTASGRPPGDWSNALSLKDVVIPAKKDRTWRHGTTVLEFSRVQNIGHPTAKPLALVETLVKGYTKENDLILDPFIGSGTTAVACKNLNRRYIGIEKNPDYVQIALNRLL